MPLGSLSRATGSPKKDSFGTVGQCPPSSRTESDFSTGMVAISFFLRSCPHPAPPPQGLLLHSRIARFPRSGTGTRNNVMMSLKTYY